MKNIHVLPTDKPSRYVTNYMEQTMQWQNLFITSDEEIKVGDWICDIELNRIEQCLYSGTFRNWKKIILTTDQDLTKDGVQAIDDEFLEWFVKNPSCEWVEVENSGPGFPAGIYFINYLPEHFVQETTIPKEEPKQETLEEAAYQRAVDRNWNPNSLETRRVGNEIIEAVKFGAKWQQERMYSKEEIESIWKFALYSAEQHDKFGTKNKSYFIRKDVEEFIEQFKKK